MHIPVPPLTVEAIHADNDAKHYAVRFRGFAGEIAVSREKYMEVVSLLRDKFARLDK